MPATVKIKTVWQGAFIYALTALGIAVGMVVVGKAEMETEVTFLATTWITLLFFSGALSIRSAKGD